MKRIILPVLLAVLAFVAAACGLNTAAKKSGYAVGMSIGQSLASIKDKIDVDQVVVGLNEQLAGKTTLPDPEIQQLLMGLSQGQAGDKGKTGYAVGASIGRNVKPVVDLVDVASLVNGLKDQMAGKTKLDENAMREALQALTQRQKDAQAKANVGKSAKNKADGAAYLAANKAKPGVKVTASGLQYEVLKAGTGPKPKVTSTVRVHYTGTLTDGTKFDSSVDRGQPAVFPLNGVIAGWTEGLQLMNVGSKFRFVIPSELAYGANGAGNLIGPDAVLVFDVELLAIVKK